MSYSVLRITDGTVANTINLLEPRNGFLLSSWRPAIAPFKGGGVWQSSPLVDGRRMAMRAFDNAVETFNLALEGENQDVVIGYIQELTSLLEKAVAYWTTNWQYEPVWLEVRGADETNIRYAVIKNYTLEGLNSPFEQPFYRDCNPVMRDLSLILERDHWLDHEPGSEHCINLNTLQTATVINDESSPEAQSGDDALMTFITSGSVAIDGEWCRAGYIYETDELFISGMRFPSVSIPKGATIINAYIRVYVDGTDDDTQQMRFSIFGENTDNANVFTTDYNEFSTRRANHTSEEEYLVSLAGTWTLHTNKDFPVTSIIQALVNRAGWSPGNAMAFFVSEKGPTISSGTTNYRSWAAFDNASHPAEMPTLYVSYYDASTEDMGREDTCTGVVYIANKHNTAQITNIYYYDLSTDTYTNVIQEINDHGYPTLLLPSPPEAGDIIYFGNYTGYANHGPFDSLVFDLLTASSGLYLVWAYPCAAGPPITWCILRTYGNSDLFNAGETHVVWEQPSDWVEATINGVNAWWVKATVVLSGYPPITAPQQQERKIYSIVTPFVDIDAASVPGEITALSRIRIMGSMQYPTYFPGSDLVAVGLRSLSRGENFSAYLNFSNLQNPIGINADTVGGIVSDSSAPTGKCIQNISLDTSGLPGFWWLGWLDFSSTIANEFKGIYHAYARIKQVGGSVGDISYQLDFRPGSGHVYSQIAIPKILGEVTILDFGVVEFGTGESMTLSDTFQSAEIMLGYKTTASGIEMNVYDLILIPVDEWCGIYTNSSESLLDQRILDLDATGVIKTQRALLRKYLPPSFELPSSDEFVYEEWLRQSRGGPILQANANQRLWFLTSGKTSTEEALRGDFFAKEFIRVYRNSRYLTMRGVA